MRRQSLIPLFLTVWAACAASADYYVVIPSRASAARAEEISVTLAGAPLPSANVAKAYSYDLTPLLTVAGDPAFDSAKVSWTAESEIPSGMSFKNGLLSGSPTTINDEGLTLDVQATYKAKSARQSYTLVVNGELLRVTQLSAAYVRACAVTVAGGVVCWGYGGYGELGAGEMSAYYTSPRYVSGLASGVVQVELSSGGACALKSDGTVWCWGQGDSGELGNGATANSAVPVKVIGLSGVNEISSNDSSSHFCARAGGGAVSCWGFGASGQLGTGSKAMKNPVPVPIVGLPGPARQISVGGGLSCALIGYEIYCWGTGYGSVWGTGQTPSEPMSQAPRLASALGEVVAFSTDGSTSCAIQTSAYVMCWGYNGSGQLGQGHTSNVTSSIPVPGMKSADVKSIKVRGAVCAVTQAGVPYCWGSDQTGSLGVGSPAYYRLSPTLSAAIGQPVSAIVQGNGTGYFVHPDGTVDAVGDSQLGELGSGPDQKRTYSPVKVWAPGR